ncbi:MAG TPA: tellurite resistance TerB family protein [Myxococcales bacterium]|jgi:tellurite resistance protein
MASKPKKPAATKKQSKAPKQSKQEPVSPQLDLSNPKEKAVLDVLALAMSADDVVTAAEMKLAVVQMQALLKLPKTDKVLTRELTDVINTSVLSIQAKGREPILDRALMQIETEDERRMLFALATSMSCADGSMHPAEAKFLSQLRLGLGLSEAEALQGVAGVAALMAQHPVA